MSTMDDNNNVSNNDNDDDDVRDFLFRPAVSTKELQEMGPKVQNTLQKALTTLEQQGPAP